MGAHLSVPMYRRSLPERLRIARQAHGVIEAVTEIAPAAAPPEFLTQGRYWVAVVRLAEGGAITAQLTGITQPPRIGQPVEAVLRRLYEQEGVVRYGFKFRPREVEA